MTHAPYILLHLNLCFVVMTVFLGQWLSPSTSLWNKVNLQYQGINIACSYVLNRIHTYTYRGMLVQLKQAFEIYSLNLLEL